jgi:hypothetical protein
MAGSNPIDIGSKFRLAWNLGLEIVAIHPDSGGTRQRRQHGRAGVRRNSGIHDFDRKRKKMKACAPTALE